jgi:hypothetical protein
MCLRFSLWLALASSRSRIAWAAYSQIRLRIHKAYHGTSVSGLNSIIFPSSFHLYDTILSNMLTKYMTNVRPCTKTRQIIFGLKTVSCRNLSSTPVTVPVTLEEVAARKLGWHNLEMATRALHRDGLVVLQNVIQHSKLDALNKTMVRDALKLQALGDAGPFNYNKVYATSKHLVTPV